MKMVLKNNKILAAVFLITSAVLLMTTGICYGSRYLTGLSGDGYITVFQDQFGLFTPRVNEKTFLTKQKVFVCKDIEVTAKEPVAKDLIGFSRKELVERFSSEGWEVTFTAPNSLVLTESSDQLCPIHRNYRHLGLFQDRLAVYEGPLGYDGKVIRVETIAAASLPGELKVKLMQAMDLKKQSDDAIEKLRNDLEFSTEEALNAALENMDEHSID